MSRVRRRYENLRLISGNANRGLAKAIARELCQPLEKARVDRFADGEVRVDIKCVVRGTDVFVIQPICQSHRSPVRRPCLAGGASAGNNNTVCTYQSINDNLMELLVMIDAARRASAGRITAVVPYLAYAKQEKKKRGHEPITAKLVANLITMAGAQRLLVVDLHTPAIEGFFDIPVDHMVMHHLMGTHFRNLLDWRNAVVVSPDAGGVARATGFRDHFKRGLEPSDARNEMAIAFKQRPVDDEASDDDDQDEDGPGPDEFLPGQDPEEHCPEGTTGESESEDESEESLPDIIELVGDVEGRPAVIYDDMIQSGGTLLQVVRKLKDYGATEIHAAAVHADFTPTALAGVRDSPLSSLALSDTTAAALDVCDERIQIVTSARILAQAVWRIHTNQSVGWIFRQLRRFGELPPVDPNC